MTDSDLSDVVPASAGPRVSWSTILTIAAFSAITVYATAASLHTIDVDTGVVAAEMSVKEYRQLVAGERGYPYQWRMLGTYLVYGGERLTGLPPHAVDIALKTVLLWASTLMLFLFSRWYTSEAGAYAVIAFYLLLTIPAFTDEQYRIYFTNDYAMLACWFAAVYMIRAERYVAAALLTFVGAWAKETMLLVPVLLGFQAIRSRRMRTAFVLTAAAFVVPTAILRAMYPAPLSKWAWWDMVFANVPFLQSSMYEFRLTIKNNVKVALFYNVFWILAARRVLAGSDRFAKNLAATAVVYLIIAYPVIYIRELRHFLPLAIVVLPMAISAIEQRSADRGLAATRVP
jgi:hypothetical protein